MAEISPRVYTDPATSEAHSSGVFAFAAGMILRPDVPIEGPLTGTFSARGGTIGYLVTADAVVVVDSQFADTAPMFLEGMKPKTQRKFDLLIPYAGPTARADAYPIDVAIKRTGVDVRHCL